jgi:hypothetical protein
MKTYPALFAAIGGRDGMDAGGVHQMTCAIYRTHQLFDFIVLGTLEMIFLSGKHLY